MFVQHRDDVMRIHVLSQGGEAPDGAEEHAHLTDCSFTKVRIRKTAHQGTEHLTGVKLVNDGRDDDLEEVS